MIVNVFFHKINQTEELTKHLLMTDREFINVNCCMTNYESEYKQYVRVKQFHFTKSLQRTRQKYYYLATFDCQKIEK